MASKRSAKEAPPASATPSEVKVQPAKGRPMLQWVGKRPLTRVPAYPAQHIETFDPTGSFGKAPAAPALWTEWPGQYPRGGLLFHGDNKEVLAHLLANGYRGKVDLVYIDPPFDSGADYVRQISLRGDRLTRLSGEDHSLGEQLQYLDIWADDTYLQFTYERLLLLRELLSPEGTIYVHLDTNRGYAVRAILDEAFGRDGFRNEIIWQRTTSHSDTRGRYGEVHDVILGYSRSNSPRWNSQYLPYSDSYADSKYSLVEEGSGRRYRLGDMTAPGPRPNLEYEWRGVRPPPGRCWSVNRGRMEELEGDGRLVYSKSGMPQYKRYLDEMEGTPVHDVWTDIPPVNPMAAERLDYPTQKPEALLDRLIRGSTDAGSIVLDCFAGSGTTASVAQRLGRRWIACDINRGAIQTASKRLQALIREQAEDQRLLRDEGDEPAPTQLAFTVWRVNDYDLQIQHNEAVNLACDFIGVERLRSDGFFDGTLGKSLVKVVPFNHPLTPLDLEEVKRELEARPDEDRSVTLVSLGIEIGAQAWIDEWNRMRRGKNAVNRIEVIELRTDPRYGGVIRHEPARAKVKVRRAKGRLHVEIEDFVSPTIIQRLQQQGGLLNPQVDDWRAMVDSISIDPTYYGEVLNIAIADVPERKSDLVSGKYDLEAPEGETTIAVKIIDMLGEEVLVTERV